MAPLIKTALKYLLVMCTQRYNQAVTPSPGVNEHVLAEDVGSTPSLSVVSFGPDHLSVFGVDKSTGVLSHKLWDGKRWYPNGIKMDLLGGLFNSPPMAVSMKERTIEVFAVDSYYEDLRYKYFDGAHWFPSKLGWNILSNRGLLTSDTALSVTSRGSGIVDIFGQGSGGEDIDTILHLYHIYRNGSDWSEWEDLGGKIDTSPAVIAPYVNHLEIYAKDLDYDVQMIEWDGSTWSEWYPTSVRDPTESDFTATTSGEGLYDIFLVGEGGELYHRHTKWGAVWEEDVGMENNTELTGKPAVIAAQGSEDSPKRIDVVMLGKDQKYYHVNGTGIDAWSQWSCHGGNFGSAPAIISWANDTAQRLDIFGITTDGQLVHQAWTGKDWYPAIDEWEIIGGNLKVFAPGLESATHREL